MSKNSAKIVRSWRYFHFYRKYIPDNIQGSYLRVMVDLKGFEPSTSRMRTNQKLCFVLIFSCFQRFRLECKWSCGLFFPL